MKGCLVPQYPMGNPASGDRVRLTASTPEGAVTHEGILLSPAASGHITVKLDNGYNVTFAESEVSEISLLSQAVVVEENLDSGIDEDSELPEIWILHLSLIHISEPTRPY